jgi:hypothetical protein
MVGRKDWRLAVSVALRLRVVVVRLELSAGSSSAGGGWWSEPFVRGGNNASCAFGGELGVGEEEAWRGCGGLRGTLRLSRWLEVVDVVGDNTVFVVGLCTDAVEIGKRVSGPRLRARRCPLPSGSGTLEPGPGLGCRLLTLPACACACCASAMARCRSSMCSRLLDSSVLTARVCRVVPEFV